MLTATFNSYGDRQISTPHKIYTPEPIDKKSAELITPARGLLYQIWQKSIQWGLLGKWVKYNKNYFYLFIYLYLFSLISLQVRPLDGFLRAIAQKT